MEWWWRCWLLALVLHECCKNLWNGDAMAFRFRTYIKSHYIYLYERVGRGGRMPFHWFAHSTVSFLFLCFAAFRIPTEFCCVVMAGFEGSGGGDVSVYIVRTV